MLPNSSRQWPGAILTFLYLASFIVGSRGGDVFDGRPVTIQLREKSPAQVYQPLEYLAPSQKLEVRHHKKKVETSTFTQLVTVAASAPSVASNTTAVQAVVTSTVTMTMIMTAAAPAPTTVFVTMPPATITDMMTTVTVSAVPTPAAAMAAAAMAAPAPAAPAPAPAGPPNANVVSQPGGMVSVLTLGFLTTESGIGSAPTPIINIANQKGAVFTATMNVMPTQSVMTTVIVEQDSSIVTRTVLMDQSMTVPGMPEATGENRMESSKMGMEKKSEASVSGRQAATRSMGFGAVVIAVAVAVLIL